MAVSQQRLTKLVTENLESSLASPEGGVRSRLIEEIARIAPKFLAEYIDYGKGVEVHAAASPSS
jgi:hypothetical protein